MSIYHNLRSDSPITSIEFPVEFKNDYIFFHVKNTADKETVRSQLAVIDPTRQIISETPMGDHKLWVVRINIDKTQSEILEALKKNGDHFVEPEVKKSFNPWKWRGITSIVGQGLQLFSGFLSTKKGSSDRPAILLFASTNLLANITNITFGSQKKNDPHQLRILKEEFNKKIAAYMPQGEALLTPDDQRSVLRPEAKEHESFGQKAHAVAKKYSVSGGEIGLRFFGASSLSFPITKWKKGLEKLQSTRSLGAAFKEVRNTNPVTYKVGLITVLGKIISFVSKEPDPFNPAPPSWLDKIREKATFPLSSIVEGYGAAWMAHDRFFKQKIPFNGKKYPDFFGGIGNIVFIAGYVIRFFAPYGSLEVNMRELNAHITDSLAKMPRDKLPQLLAETSVSLSQHFKAKKLNVSDIYNDLAQDLKQYHHIDVAPAQGMASSEQRNRDESAGKSFASPDMKASFANTKKKALTYQERVDNASVVVAASMP